MRHSAGQCTYRRLRWKKLLDLLIWSSENCQFLPSFFPVFQDILEDSVPVYVGFLVMMAWAPGPWCFFNETTGPLRLSLVTILLPGADLLHHRHSDAAK